MANINSGHRYSVIDANALALRVRDYFEANLISFDEAAQCLASETDEEGNALVNHFAAERMDRVFSR